MATVLLVRHGRSTANASHVLAGRLPGTQLDEAGEAQAAALGQRLAGLVLAEAWTSPLERCDATAQAALAQQAAAPSLQYDESFLECDYGAWQGRSIPELAKEPLWSTVQSQPSAATFPDGESMVAMSQRVVRAVREHDARITAEHGPEAVWLLASHGDPIKAVLADALGMHLDLFQRITVDPASVSIVRYTSQRPYVVMTNSSHGDLAWLSARREKPAPVGDDAVVGGGAGHPESPVGTGA